MRYNNVELNVLIKNKRITEYAHNSQTFVEGRAGSAFEIELVNHNSFEVEAIVSVDGLSVIDGKEAGPQSSGYLLSGHETLRIPGWKLDSKAVAAFEFSGKGHSYAAQTTGSARNTGVIGVLVYKGKDRPVLHSLINGQTYSGWSSSDYRSLLPTTWSSNEATGGFLTPTSADCSGEWQARGLTVGINSVSATASADRTVSLNSATDNRPRSFTGGLAKSSVMKTADAPQVQNLGTGFGEKLDFNTTTVSFERGDMLALTVLYYDDARGLRSRGIVLERRAPRIRPVQAPEAFPAMGCTPPKGWRG